MGSSLAGSVVVFASAASVGCRGDFPIFVGDINFGHRGLAWGLGVKQRSSPNYQGPSGFSEPETRVLARLAAEWRPDVFVDVRSGDRYMAMPYASREDVSMKYRGNPLNRTKFFLTGRTLIVTG